MLLLCTCVHWHEIEKMWRHNFFLYVCFRAEMFDHMTHDHGFSIGLPDNLGLYFLCNCMNMKYLSYLFSVVYWYFWITNILGSSIFMYPVHVFCGITYFMSFKLAASTNNRDICGFKSQNGHSWDQCKP